MLVNKERAERTLLLIHGTITYKRTILVPHDKQSADILLTRFGKKSVCPIDDELGVSNLPFKITCQAMSYIAKVATKSRSYNDASEELTIFFGKKIDVKTVERVTDYVGHLMFNSQCAQAEKAKALSISRKIDARRIRKRDDDVLYLETDGAMVHVRDKEHVTMTNEQIKEAEEAWMKGHDKLPKYDTAWAESKHAICFHARNIKYYFESPDGSTFSGRFETVLKYIGTETKVTNHKIEKRDCIGYIGSADQFQYHFLALAERNGWVNCSKVVILSDGATWIKKVKDNMFKRKNVIQILDLFHAKENAGKFAHAVKSGAEAVKYADHLCELIENGEVNTLLIELEEYKDRKMPAGIPNLYTYIYNNKENMNYPAYRAAGLFVGSGAMESANIYIMQDRMKLPGMRWNVINGRHMLCLKCHYESQTWYLVDAELSKLSSRTASPG